MKLDILLARDFSPRLLGDALLYARDVFKNVLRCLPKATCWFVIGLVVFAPDTVSEIIYWLQAASAADIVLAIRGLLTGIIPLIFLIMLALPPLLGAGVSPKNHARKALNQKLQQHFGTAEEEEFVLVPVDRGSTVFDAFWHAATEKGESRDGNKTEDDASVDTFSAESIRQGVTHPDIDKQTD
jgi:hypothetical protein